MQFIGDIINKNIRSEVEICPNCEADIEIIYKTINNKEHLHKVIWKEFNE